MENVNVVNEVTLASIIDLRARLLRPGQPIQNSFYAEDSDSTTLHLGVINSSQKIVCIGTFIQQSHLHFLDSKLSYRLRGMATESEFQKKGFGKSLLNEAQTRLKSKGCDLLWFNARMSAEGFYKKLGFEVFGEIFDIPKIGPHQVMFKKL